MAQINETEMNTKIAAAQKAGWDQSKINRMKEFYGYGTPIKSPGTTPEVKKPILAPVKSEQEYMREQYPEPSKDIIETVRRASKSLFPSAYYQAYNIVKGIPDLASLTAKFAGVGMPEGMSVEDKKIVYDEQKKAFEQVKQLPQAIWNDLKERYGGWDRFKKTLENDPASILLDASVIYGGFGTARRIAAGVIRTVGPEVGALDAKALAAIERRTIEGGKNIPRVAGTLVRTTTKKERLLKEIADWERQMDVDLSGKVPVRNLAERAGEGFKKTLATEEEIADELYASAAKRAGKQGVFLNDALNYVKTKIKELSDSEVAKYENASEIKFLTRIEKDLSTPLTYDRISGIRNAIKVEYRPWKVDDPRLNSIKKVLKEKVKDNLTSEFSSKDPEFATDWAAANTQYKNTIRSVGKNIVNQMPKLIENGQWDKLMETIINPGTSKENIKLIMEAAGTPDAQAAIKSYVAKSIVEGAEKDGIFNYNRLAKQLSTDKGWGENLEYILGKKDALILQDIKTIAKQADGLKDSVKYMAFKKAMVSSILRTVGADRFLYTPLGIRWLQKFGPAVKVLQPTTVVGKTAEFLGNPKTALEETGEK